MTAWSTSVRHPAATAARILAMAALAVAAAAATVSIARAQEPAEAPPATPAAAAAPAAKPEAPPPMPDPPAFFSVAVSRIRNIDADGFAFEQAGGKTVRIRLADADCSTLDNQLRSNGATVARSLLETSRVWIFPCGCAKDLADNQPLARVWTDKGWLDDVLARAGYAVRRPMEAPAMAPLIVPGTTNEGLPPAPPAFCARSLVPLEGDVFEARAGAVTKRVGLFDVTCQGLDTDQAEAARALCRTAVGDGPAWVFPCVGAETRGRCDLRARIWTSRGWLGAVLLEAKLAQPYEDPFKAVVRGGTAATPGQETTSATPEPPQDPAKTPPVPRGERITWRPITLRAARVVGGSMQGAETETFPITTGVWRIAWNCRPPRAGFKVIVNVYRVDEAWEVRVSSHHVTSLPGQTGSTVLRTGPGTYWIKLSCSDEWQNIKVEEAVPAN